MHPSLIFFLLVTRDRIHNLDLNLEAHREIYDIERYNYIKALEEERLTRYFDGSGPANGGKGNTTIGIGFNMDVPGAEAIWNKVLPNVSFKDTKNVEEKGDIDILPEHSRALFSHVVNENEKVLKTNHYNDGYWEKMKPNERLAIEAPYYQCKGAQVGKNTEYGKNMKLYLDTLTKFVRKDMVYVLKYA